MADIDFNAANAIKEILPDIIDYAGFYEYMEKLPFQTIQMQSKQVLRVWDKDLEDIVKLEPAVSSYIDGEYYKVVMDE